MGGRILCNDNIDIVLLTDAAREEKHKTPECFCCVSNHCVKGCRGNNVWMQHR